VTNPGGGIIAALAVSIERSQTVGGVVNASGVGAKRKCARRRVVVSVGIELEGRSPEGAVEKAVVVFERMIAVGRVGK